MAINLVDKIIPKNAAFVGLVDANQIIGLVGGTATVSANNLTCVVNHNLGTVPKVFVEPQSIGGVMHFISTKTTTQFTINLPAPQDTDVDFDWEAILL